MESDRRRLWFLLALTAIAVVAGALILKSALPGGGASPLATPSTGAESPLPGPDESPLDAGTPGLSDDVSPPLWPSAAAALSWVAMGIILALGLSAAIRRLRRPTG